MNNNAKLWWIIGAIVVIALAAYLWMNRSDETMVESDTAMNEQMETDVMADEPRSLRDLMASSSPITCEFRDAESKSEGTIYAADNKIRGDFQLEDEGSTTKGHLIIDNMTMYTWMDGEDKGFMMTLSEEQMDQAEAESEARTKTLDPDKKIDYECGSWSGDSAQFERPSNVEFSDYSSMMENIDMGGGASGSMDMKVMQCAACDNAPEASRASCKAALGCN